MYSASSKKITKFKNAIKAHYRKHGRHDLAWRKTRDPYAILVSEVMLQQTQVARVEGFYERWLAKFPDFASLACAKTADVLSAWQGLGYNRRALALQKLALIIMKEHGGVLPQDREALLGLPGLGRGTSGSLMAFAFNRPEPFIETNIRRVFIHFFFPRTRNGVTDAEIERYIKKTLDLKNPREWYWALMDYGAAMPKMENTKKTPNPNRKSAHYRKQAAFKGSGRELRGKILRCLLAAKKGMAAAELSALTGARDEAFFGKILSSLREEGFISQRSGLIYIKGR